MKTQLLLAAAVIGAPLALTQSAFALNSSKSDTTSKEDAVKNPLDLLPAQLTNAKGEKVSKDALKGKIVGVYFSAHWCPPCRAFTPELVKFRDANSAEFEVVFVSSDNDAAAMKGYMEEAKMQWLAVPFKDKAKESLAKRFKVEGIPSLIILGPDGKVITEDGRGDVTSKKNDALAAWKKKLPKA